MRYKDFITKVQELGYDYEIDLNRILVKNDDGIHATICFEKVNQLDTRWDAGINTELFDLCIELARTPLKEREESKREEYKRYQYKLNIPFLKDGVHYLNNIYDEFMLNTGSDSVLYQTVFTRDEVAHLDLSSFEEIEYV